MDSREYVISAPAAGILRERPAPVVGVGQALVRVIQNGLCASDLAEWLAPVKAPLPIGHEPVATVVAVGEGASVQVGDLVTGRITPSYSDFALADNEDIVRVPNGLPASSVLGEPLGCVVEGARRSRLVAGQSTVVIGAGYMGLLMMQVLSATGAASVAAIDTRSEALDHATANGADRGYISSAVPSTIVDSYDLVVEASGSQAGLDLATSLVRSHGTLSLLGYHQGRRQIDAAAWNWKAIDVVNAHVRDPRLLAASTRAGLALQLAGKINPAALITHRYGMSEVDDAFRTLQAKPSGYVKAVIEMD